MESNVKYFFNTKNLILCALIIIGIVLTFVGLFGPFIKGWDTSSDLYLTLSDLVEAVEEDEEDDSFIITQLIKTLNTFAKFTFVFAVANVIAVIAIAYLLIPNGKKIVWFCSFFNLVFGILVFVFSFKVAKEGGGDLSYGPLLVLFGTLLVSVSCVLVKKDFSICVSALLLFVILLTGFVFATVGLSGNIMSMEWIRKTTFSLPTLSAFNARLSSEALLKIEFFPLVNAFAWVLFAFTFLCVFLFIATTFFGATKHVYLSSILGITTIVFSVLVLIFSIVMVRTNSANEFWKTQASFSLCASPIIMMVGGVLAGGSLIWLAKAKRKMPPATTTHVDQTDESIQKMRDLVEAGILSEEQYLEKKKELTSQKKKTQSLSEMDANLKKMKELVDAGILSQEDYEKKKTELETQKEQLNKEFLALKEMVANLKKMRELVDCGILSEADFEKKKTELNLLKKLDLMVDTGVITKEEFEARKQEILEIYGDLQ